MLYSYLNLESTKTTLSKPANRALLYSYLNLESTKTFIAQGGTRGEVVQLLKS